MRLRSVFIRPLITTAAIFLCCISMTNCVFIKKAKIYGIPDNKIEKIEHHSSSNYYIVHIENKMFQINEIITKNNHITGKISEVDPKVLRYYLKANNKSSFKKVALVNRKYAFQVHIFADQFKKEGNTITINNQDIKKVDIYKTAPGKGLLVGTGTTIVSITGFLIIACNCPHVYINDGQNYSYNNTLYTGATSKTLERHDYQLMPDYFPNSNSYNLVIHNEENEQQFTNQLELMVIQHDEKIDIISDQKGNIYSLKNSISPIKTITNSNQNINDKVIEKDDLVFNFDNTNTSDYSDIIASFKKPENVKDAKLIVKVKNSTWSGFVYNEFSKLFGRYYDNWVNSNAKKPLEEVKTSMIKAGIPLVISIKKENKWIDIETIDLVGDITFNTLAIHIKESLITGDDIQIRIRSGFKFWSIDYLALDFSKQSELSIQYLQPSIAEDKNGLSYVSQLSNDDNQYMDRLENSSEISVKFDKLKSDKKRTIILHSKGYYLPMKSFNGRPNKKELAKFKNEAELSRYSKQLFEEYYKLFATVSK